MIELKNYQNEVIDDFKTYFEKVIAYQEANPHEHVFNDIQTEKGIESRYERNGLDVPFLCVKIPTGGGKTIVACSVLRVIHETYTVYKNGKGLVLWLVPSKTIRDQTLAAFRDHSHPYRSTLMEYFGNDLKIFDIDEANRIKKSDIEDNLCIVITTFSTFRITDPDKRIVYDENGYLLEHFTNINEIKERSIKTNFGVLNDAARESLVNVFRMNRPIIVVDEGHNVQTNLSTKMFDNLNPSIIVEYTATPRRDSERKSNVLVNINGYKLKEEYMVKIPMYLQTVTDWRLGLLAAVQKRSHLEEIAVEESMNAPHEYIRPILLIQAGPINSNENSINVNEVLNELISNPEYGISRDEIKIKTSDKNELKDVDLLSKDCRVRVIITIKALAEGWDNPFAYVLISLANIGSVTSVTQIIGRVIRLPNQREKMNPELNHSYVYSISNTFIDAANELGKELVQHGYTSDDVRDGENNSPINDTSTYEQIIDDKDIKLPCISVRGSNHKLTFRHDLIGDEFEIANSELPDSEMQITTACDNNTEIDLTRIGDYELKAAESTLDIVINDPMNDPIELIDFLDRRLIHKGYKQADKRRFIEKMIDFASRTYTMDILSAGRFQLLQFLRDHIKSIENDHARSIFDELLNSDSLTTKFESLPQKIKIMRENINNRFSKHLFESFEMLNDEELRFVSRIDRMENVLWWYRNRAKKDFYIQGWEPRKIYPDFIIKTKLGNYFVVEYKGVFLRTTADTEYKEELGNIWERLSGKHYSYKIIIENDIGGFIRDLGRN